MMKDTKDQAPYFFHQGTNNAAYRYLGAHREESEGGFLYTFRTWAPFADALYLVGDFCDWECGLKMERVTEKGVYEVAFESAEDLSGHRYKFRVVTDGISRYKGDPYAKASLSGIDGASVFLPESSFVFSDEGWLAHRKETVISRDGSYLPAPLNIYELHLGSFVRKEDGSSPGYRELADLILPYVKYMGYTHVELLPVTEYPYDGSWGYQVCAYYSPTSRFGTPDDFRYFVDKLHQGGIGVILDWVPAHFPKDAWGLYEFDGHPLYEYQGKDRQESRSWGTRYFDLGREEVQSFLISNALYWFREFHADGLRVDAVAAMLYLDYDREPGEWIPNAYGGNRNLEAEAFFRKLNTAVFGEFPDVLMIAEESTAWPGVTSPACEGGLGFNLKWNMGFANDLYRYLESAPEERPSRHQALNFPITYAFSENYILPISHDEVVHGKKSFLNKMHGSYEEKFAQARTSLLYIMTFPGKKMLFMGTEYGQFSEWNYKTSLEWFMLGYETHNSLREYTAALNRFYLSSPALYEKDFVPEGFEWLLPDERERSLVAYRRLSLSGDALLVVLNFSNRPSGDVVLSLKEGGSYECVFAANEGAITPSADAVPDGDGFALSLTLDPYSGGVYRLKNDTLTL